MTDNEDRTITVGITYKGTVLAIPKVTAVLRKLTTSDIDQLLLQTGYGDMKVLSIIDQLEEFDTDRYLAVCDVIVATKSDLADKGAARVFISADHHGILTAEF